MIPVPELTQADVIFGNIKHMPSYDSVPDEFKKGHNPYCRMVSKWFYSGLNSDDLIVKEGIDKTKALAALRAIIGSFEPKHEHKEAGAAYLMSQWFDLKEAA